MGQKVGHGNALEAFLARYNREAVARLESLSVSASQIASEPGSGANIPGISEENCVRG